MLCYFCHGDIPSEGRLKIYFYKIYKPITVGYNSELEWSGILYRENFAYFPTMDNSCA